MEFLNYIGIFFQNAITIICFYTQMYFSFFILAGVLLLAGIIEYKEKRFLTVEDERKVI